MSTDTPTPIATPLESIMRANDLSDPSLRLGLAAALGDSGFNNRDRYDAFGWEVDPSEEEYAGLYLRNPYGGGLIDKSAQLAWRHDPDIVDTAEQEDDTEFEEDVQKLGRSHDFWTYLSRCHRAAGFGEFALVFVDFDDVNDLNSLDDAVDYDDASLDNIRGFRVIPQFAVDEVEHGDFGSERWGEPEHYTVDWGEDINDDLDETAGSSKVHHSRLIEVPSKPPLTEEYSSRPRLERILNTLYDIEKLLGSAAEMSYRGADKGLNLNVDPTKVDPNKAFDEDQKQDIQEWLHGLQPTLNTVGTEVKDLGGEIRDPSGALDAELKSLSAATGFSKQFIEGAAAGEIASSETNMRNDFGEIRERQQQYVEPYLVRRGLDVLMDAGVLPRPEGGEYDVEWPDLFELSDEEQAGIEQTRSEVARNLGMMGEPAQQYVAEGEFPEDGPTPMAPLDESNPGVLAQFEQGQAEQPDDSDDQTSNDDTLQRRDVLNNETLEDGETHTHRVETANATRYTEGDPVQSPQGLGVVVEVRTESFEGKDGEEIDASTSSPTYVVGLKDGRVGVGFYTASQLDAAELPETDVEDPVGDMSAQTANADGVADRVLEALNLRANDWSMPRSWREADTPARVILLDAWSSMNGQFDCGGGCCMGELGDRELCAAMKDEALGGWTGWRDGGD